MGQPGLATEPKTKSVRVTVVGHASARWSDAKNQKEADRLNEALSNQRGDNVRNEVERLLKRETVNVKIVVGGTSGGRPDGVLVGSYGVGSREPVLNPAPKKFDPNDDHPINRSVTIAIEMVTTTYGQGAVSLPDLKLDARTRFWYGKVMAFQGGAMGAAGYYLKLTIQNSVSGKVAMYQGYLFGGGVSVTSKSPVNIDKGDLKQLQNGIGDEFSFDTGKAMGFDDFDDEWVRIEKVGAALGIKAKVSYFSFLNLGKDAKMLAFEKGFSVGMPALDGILVSGKIRISSNPGDYYMVDGGTGLVGYTTDEKTREGLILTFPTGKSMVSDLTAEDRKRLEDFVVRWAHRF